MDSRTHFKETLSFYSAIGLDLGFHRTLHDAEAGDLFYEPDPYL
jgi:hypothetical protein